MYDTSIKYKNATRKGNVMDYYISDDCGSGMEFIDKKAFMREISYMIDDCVANGGTEFSARIDADASCYWCGEDDGVNADKNHKIAMAEQILIDNGLDPDEAQVVLQAIGYAFDVELYPE